MDSPNGSILNTNKIEIQNEISMRDSEGNVIQNVSYVHIYTMSRRCFLAECSIYFEKINQDRLIKVRTC